MRADDPTLEPCLTAFAVRDYIGCHQAALAGLKDDDAAPVLRQLVIICMQRLGQSEGLTELPRLMLDSAADDWERSLLELTFGRVDIDSVRNAAANGDQRCQAAYYAGARMLTLIRADSAQALFRECVDSNSRRVERRLAEIELAAISSADAPEPAEQAFDVFCGRAKAHTHQGRFDEAINAATEACDLARRTWGPNHIRYAQGLGVLLGALAYADRTAEGLELAPLALDLGHRHYNDIHPDLASLLNTIAYLHKASGNLDEAGRLYQAAADIWHQSTDHVFESAAALNNLGQVAVEREEFDHAAELFHRVLEAILGLDDDQGLRGGVLNNLALVRQRQGDLEAAARLHRDALELRREQVGEQHPLYAASLNNLAHVYKEQGRFADAEPLFHQAVEILEHAAGLRHPHTVMAMSALVEIYEATGQQEAVDRLVARLRPQDTRSAPGGAHELHPLPVLTPLFRRLRKDTTLTANELQPVGGAVDWRSPYYQRLLGELAEDFAERRYGECVRRGILLNAYEATHESLQLYLMCVAQAASGGDLRAFATLQRVIDDPWYRALVGITLGETNPAELEPLITTAERAVQFRFYLAQRQAVEGHAADALIDLQVCAASNVECFETWLAARLCRALPPASDRNLANQVRRMNGAVVELLSRGDFYAAQEPAEEAWRLAAGLEEHTRERVLSIYNIGLLSYKLGDLARAEQLLTELVTLARGREPYDRAAVAGALNTLGILYTDLASFERAETVLLDALEEMRRAGQQRDPNYAQLQGNLAELYREMGDLETAIQYCREALETKRASLGVSHHEYARTLANLGTLYLEADALPQAEKLLQEAMRIRRAALPPDHADLGVNAHALAHLYLRLRRYEQAEAMLQMSLRASRAEQPNMSYAVRLVSLSGVYQATERLDEAERCLREARSIIEGLVGPLHPHVAVVVSNLAALFANKGDMPAALAMVKASEEGTSQLLYEVFRTASERQRLQLHGTLQLRLSALLTLVDAVGRPTEEVEYAFELVQRRKAIVADAQANLREEIEGDGQRDLRAKYAHVRSLREKIARKTLSGPGPEGPDAHAATLASWTAERERQEAELARLVPQTRLQRQLRETSAPLIRARLPEGSSLIEIVRFAVLDFGRLQDDQEPPAARYRYWAFVIRPDPQDALTVVDLGDAVMIDELVAEYRTAVGGRTGRDVEPENWDPGPCTEREAGTRLRVAVFDPLIDALQGDHRLLLCPDGDLARLPWEVLPLDQDRRIIDEYEISYLGVARDLLRIAAPRHEELDAPVVIADPDFELSDSGPEPTGPGPVSATANPAGGELRGTGIRFTRLQGTRREGEEVAALLGVLPLMGAEATERAVKSYHPAILHIATHGFFLPDPKPAPEPGIGALLTTDETRRFGRLSNADASPLLRSGIALAGANTWLAGGTLPVEAEDGILTAEDVAGIDLSGTELVTLSACETGLGTHHRGEGVLGLRRAFGLAGARAVVMSLWRVPDDETQLLMAEFYRRVLDGEGRATALRNAQQWIRSLQPDPYYWGAFICQGDPGPLKRSAQVAAA